MGASSLGDFLLRTKTLKDVLEALRDNGKSMLSHRMNLAFSNLFVPFQIPGFLTATFLV